MQSRLQNWWLRKRTQVKNSLPSRTRTPACNGNACPRHVLTPTSSAEDIHLRSQQAVADSMFFQRLPAELRRMILIEAFGGRTVHVDLEWDHPRQFRLETKAKGTDPSHPQLHHCGMVRSPGLGRDVSKPKAWRWFGCVCHRDPEYAVRAGPGKRLTSEPWMDTCLEGEAGWCHNWAGTQPFNCLIGCMGWLTTCRQA